MTYLNHAHTSGVGRSSAKLTTGATYEPRPAGTGICGLRSCYRCGAFQLPADLVADRVPHQRRCGGGCAKQGVKA